jgi:uncharacterized protein (TIGR02996 family)
MSDSISGEEAAFLDAIATNPDDDTARLVYADWLDEQDSSPVCCPSCRGKRGDMVGFLQDGTLMFDAGGGRVGPACAACDGAGTVPDPSRRLRAEFIRVQVELAHAPEAVYRNVYAPRTLHLPESQRIAIGQRYDPNPRFHELRTRERELLDTRHPTQANTHLADHWFSGVGVVVTHGAAGPWWWYPPAPDGATGYTFEIRRGFIDRLDVPADVWLRHGDAVLASQPVTAVQLTTLPDIVAHPSGMWFVDDPKAELFDWARITPHELNGSSPGDVSLGRISVALLLRFGPKVKIELPRLISASWDERPTDIMANLAAMRDRLLRETGAALGD